MLDYNKLSRPRAVSSAAAVFMCGIGIGAVASDADNERGAHDDEAATIDQIVVVAHKDERALRDIAANVTVVSRAQLGDELAVSVADVFRYVPGIDHEAAGTRFGAEGLNIRGIGGNRVAIVVDGVPLSDHFDVGSFSNATRDFIDAGLIETIEILHGPASALYGSAAIGGVVAVQTPDPADVTAGRGLGGDLLATYRGADASWQGQAMVAVTGESLGLLAGYSWRSGHETDSAAANDSLDRRSAERDTALIKFVADDAQGNTWRLGYVRQQSHTLSDLNSMLGTGRYRSTTALEGDDDYALDMVNASYDFGADGGWLDRGIVRAYFVDADVSQATLDERGNARTPVSIDRYFAFRQEIRGAELNLWKDLGSGRMTHRLGVGVEYRERDTEEYRDGLSTDLVTGDTTNVLLGEVFPLRDFPISTTRETGAYLEDAMSFGDWTVIAALRADRFELSPRRDPMYLEDYPFAEPVALTESDVSPKLGIVYHAGAGTDLYLQYAHGFRAPPYADANIGLEIPFFNYRAIPNPDLKSESSQGYELGLRWRGLSSSLHASLFHTRYDDFIESKVRLGTDPASGRVLFQSQNIDATRIEGIEAGWSGRWGAFGLDTAAFYARGRNEQGNTALNSVGPAQLMLALTWTSASGQRRVALKSRFARSWDDRDESSGALFKPDGYGVFDLFVTQDVGANTTLRAGVHNLADRTWWHWADVRGLAPGDPVIPYLAQPGRNASVSLNVRW